MSQELMSIVSVIKNIQSTSSKSIKMELIKENVKNKLFGELLHFIFNPYIKTNIAKKKLSKKVTGQSVESLDSIYNYMEYLKKSTGRDEHIATVQNYIEEHPVEVQWLLEAMATKDLKMGATSSTINKAFGYQLVPTFDLMLAEKYIETKKIKGVSKIYEHWQKYIGQRVIATSKLDGNRCAIFVREDGSVKLYSREGHEMDGYVDIEEAFASSFKKGYVYDGEVIATNEEGLNSKELFKKTSRIVKKKGIKKGLEFHAFDIIPIDSFESGVCEVRCEDRKETLSQIVQDANHDLVIYVEPLYIGMFDKDVIDELTEDAKLNEEEGIMVQLADAHYECKRCFSILKVKSFESSDIRCIGMYEGKSGKNIGRLGGLVLSYKGYKVNVGGGFSDHQRIEYWKNKDLVLGKIIEITFFEEFEDDNGDLDLRFAQFKCVRDDKTEESYY